MTDLQIIAAEIRAVNAHIKMLEQKRDDLLRETLPAARYKVGMHAVKIRNGMLYQITAVQPHFHECFGGLYFNYILYIAARSLEQLKEQLRSFAARAVEASR